MPKTVLTSKKLSIGNISLSSPVILAPMAGVTTLPFRVLCRNLEQRLTGTISGLYVCEMITARALLEQIPKTMTMIRFHPSESPRSVQLYTVDPKFTFQATRMIAEENLADHIDLNFGCPVPKVTRKGGGSAIPYKRQLFAQIVAAAVRGVQGTLIPITVKFRIGIDDEHITFLSAGKIAEDVGASAVILHARTASQLYSGTARWEAIAELKSLVTHIPVLGNGDIYTARDALQMMETTNCDGVVIGRGCLGRPWLFAELSQELRGFPPLIGPNLSQVGAIMFEHAQLMCEHLGESNGIRDMRKHTGWYLRGFPIGSEIRAAFSLVNCLEKLQELISNLPDTPFPEIGYQPRGRQGSAGKVHLPHGWLDDPDEITVPSQADIFNSGG